MFDVRRILTVPDEGAAKEKVIPHYSASFPPAPAHGVKTIAHRGVRINFPRIR